MRILSKRGKEFIMSEQEKIYPFTNDVIFEAVMQDESIARKIISVILGRKVEKIKNYTTQKDKKVSKASHGVRFDLYFEDDEAVYDVEMQNCSAFDMGRRCRYYQSMIDTDILKASEDYDNLKDSYIIFLCTYDPFKLDKPIYTFESICTDDAKCTIENALKLETGAKVVICNALAYNKANRDLRGLLKYLTTHKVEKDNAFIEQIDEAVQFANENAEVRSAAMNSDLKILDAKKEGISKGIEIGMERGKKQGIKQEQAKLINVLNLEDVGLSENQKRALIKKFTLQTDQ